MSQQDDESEKSHAPTAQKLEEARRKGETARSADLIAAGGYFGLLLSAMALGAMSVGHLGSALIMLPDQAPQLADTLFAGTASSTLRGVAGAVIFVLLPWYFIPAGLSFLTVLAQRGWAPSPGKIRPRLSRIDPIQNAKNKYGASGLFEFAKSFAKLLAFSTGLGLYLGLRSDDMLATLHGSPVMAATVMGRMLTELLAVIVLIAVGIGIIDMLWQRADFLRRQRMSHREVREELKRSEGDPHLKQARQQRARGRAMSQGLADVPDADVVIVNPTHVAIALKWSRAPGSAPVCVAKGVDHVALAIRDCANEHGVPVRHDPPTARALHASTEIGQEIDPDHYRVVAAAIRFSEKMRRKAGRTGS